MGAGVSYDTHDGSANKVYNVHGILYQVVLCVVHTKCSCCVHRTDLASLYTTLGVRDVDEYIIESEEHTHRHKSIYNPVPRRVDLQNSSPCLLSASGRIG